jgi:copper chaperone CopZ
LVEKVAIGTAIVSYDPAVASAEQIVETVNDTGYTAVPA